MNIKRIKQVTAYGWKHAVQITKIERKGTFFCIRIFIDILLCFNIYKMWSNQYLKEHFWTLSKDRRNELGKIYREKGEIRDEWQKDFSENRRFLLKYTSRKFELPNLREKRNKAYAKHFNMGKNCFVEYNVELSRQHYLNGTISIGNNVILAKNVFIDYSGTVIIEDDVRIANGVIIESHTHTDFLNIESNAVSKRMKICKGVIICSNAIINDGCGEIGRYALIGAGAVVRSKVPPYSIVIGNPAKIVGFKMKPEEIVEFEKIHFSDNERLSLELLEKNYNKYFTQRMTEIREFIRI